MFCPMMGSFFAAFTTAFLKSAKPSFQSMRGFLAGMVDRVTYTCYLVHNFIKTSMSGDTRHPRSYPGCIGRDVNRGTWVDPLSSNRGSNVRNVIWNQGVGSNSHGDLLLLAGTVGEALIGCIALQHSRASLGLARNLRLLAHQNHAPKRSGSQSSARYQTDTTHPPASFPRVAIQVEYNHTTKRITTALRNSKKSENV